MTRKGPGLQSLGDRKWLLRGAGQGRLGLKGEKVVKRVVGWKAWSRENFCNKIPRLLTRAVSF